MAGQKEGQGKVWMHESRIFVLLYVNNYPHKNIYNTDTDIQIILSVKAHVVKLSVSPHDLSLLSCKMPAVKQNKSRGIGRTCSMLTAGHPNSPLT